jgi:CheY-like chemotaxis protein
MNRQQRTILVIDDSATDRELYRRYLLRDREYRYTFVEAELGQAGWALWQRHQPDVVLLDYQT